MYTIVNVRPFGMFDTIIAFDALDESGNPVIVYADHRPALDIRAALAHGEQPFVDPPSYMIKPSYEAVSEDDPTVQHMPTVEDNY